MKQAALAIGYSLLRMCIYRIQLRKSKNMSEYTGHGSVLREEKSFVAADEVVVVVRLLLW